MKVKGRLKKMKRKEFKSDCMLGILILHILLHYIFQFFISICIISFWGFFLFYKHFCSFFYFMYYIFFDNFIYKSSFVGPLMFFLRLYLVPPSYLSGDLS